MKNGLQIDDIGNKFYLQNGVYHREDGPAIEWHTGEKEWYVNGLSHRENGPATDYISTKRWVIDGKLHRLDGPAIEDADGNKRWFFHGEEINCTSQEEFERIIKLRAFL